jgi:molybdate transport system ATP-binding protein
MGAGAVSLRAALRVEYPGFTLDATVAVDAGQLVAIVGPNGAGKSTLLGALAGLVPLADGRVELDGQMLDDAERGIALAPEQRPIGVVFQDLRLFPHLTVLDNVAFGPRCRGASRAVARRNAAAWLERTGMSEHAASLPAQLSGGQAQRVALARALATEPVLLLLDEPFAALDVRTRAETRRALRPHLAAFPGVQLLVTHDPLEALALAERLVVIEEGRIVQSGLPAEVAAHPRSAWIADLVGVNLLRGHAAGDRLTLPNGTALVVPSGETGDAFAVIHPRAVALHRTHPEGTPRNVWPARIDGIEPIGARVRVRTVGPLEIVAEVTPAAVAAIGLDTGGQVWVSIKATEITVYPV